MSSWLRSSSTPSNVAERFTTRWRGSAICWDWGASERRAFGIEATTIPGNGRDFGMALEPGREAFSGTIRQKLDYAVEVQINQNRSVVLAFTPGPIVDSQVAYWATVSAGFRRMRRRTVSSLVAIASRASRR